MTKTTSGHHRLLKQYMIYIESTEYIDLHNTVMTVSQ